ncbi:MAG: bifunctional tetrahydrofolate synthase/dihydrofolate synthase [Methylomonas sp.]|jgi:dihydrofolate synthase/folylpolyglutamate synthase|uniref:bifunctional tetrahydrofolate synthase/dihydrofolate synthase n=1 Tax=Methylomonas sp. TaxID=418 RepID=UPI0025FC2028|nr:bifunctional tetrahydrofolate synthase/dihydrofolate synthase [Methylomonas sp.]MCK9608110.1 bifunctional tetrahydrofolate synthase/dihydrofolate synthase [Methylomonas sp.]
MARFTALEDWLAWQEQSHPRPIDLGLERVAGVFSRLAVKPKKIPTITVAGTNGKGSCVAFLEAIYRAQGYKVGAYTSPHILRYNERIRVDGQPAADEDICAAFECIDAVRADTSLSYFEFSTLAALDVFSRAKVDVRILEVGLGGRLDAVNIVDADVALVTTIAIDHVDWLGDTVEAIGREKAGIFRSGVPAVIGDQQVPGSLLQAAREKRAELMQIGLVFHYETQAHAWAWWTDQLKLTDLPLPALQGEHQFRNASAVIMAVMCLQAVLPVEPAAICRGVREAHLNGRFQLIAGETPVLLDVGHNPQAVQTLLSYLQSYFPEVKIHAVFAMMKDKDIPGVLAMMRDRVDHWYLAPLKNPRAANVELLNRYFQQQDIKNVNKGYTDFASCFEAAQSAARSGELILIFGSFFLVSEYLSQFA